MSVQTQIKIQIINEKDFKQLLENLSRQIEVFDRFIDTGLKLKLALVNNRLSEHDAINTEQVKITAKLEKLEKDRLGVMKNIVASVRDSCELNKEPEQVHCTDLYPLLNSDDTEHLTQLRAELQEKIKHVKRIHEINSILIQNSRKVTQMTLKIITGLSNKKDKEKSQVYGAKGNLNHYQNQKVRLFSRKA